MARRLHVETKDGVVTLSGQAGSGLAAAKAVQQAESIQGVTKVRNEMSITQ
jgi:osmotically-inducible protein OsmY